MAIAQLLVEEVQGIPFEKSDRTFLGQDAPEGPVKSQPRRRRGKRNG
jgi:hypothetical protein